MFELRCTVRNCQELLVRQENELVCAANHHFDRAKQGYWPLMQPQDRKSLNAGDCDDAVLARQRWLSRGHATSLIEAIQPWTKISSPIVVSPRTLDLGCGEGTFGRELFFSEPDGFCGIDLSKRAIKLAARSWPEATWVLANADRTLPAADRSVDRVVSLFGRRPVDEISRVLSSTGMCIVAIPGEEDLIELREQAQQTGHRRSRWESVVDEMNDVGLQLVEHRLWSTKATLDSDGIRDAMAMTYRAVRHSEQSRLETMASADVTLAADLLLLRKE